MERFNVGDVITGKVTGVEDYGIFLSLSDGSSGLIHISEISPYFVRNVSDYAMIGDLIKAKIIGYDEKNHYKLSMKRLDVTGYNKGIAETSKGFSTLGSMLDLWVSDKLTEIQKKID